MPSLPSFLTFVCIAAPAIADIHSVTLPDGFFPGPQSGIGSWFLAYSSGTNGNSWCGYPYSNSDPVFAPSLNAMGGQTWESNPTAWTQDTRKYCGLEANVTDPSTGNTMKMYIGDALEPIWVRSPSSIDIMIDAFSNLNGDPKGDHDVVISSVHWEFTGNVNTQYAAPGAVWPDSGKKLAVTTSAKAAKPSNASSHAPSHVPSSAANSSCSSKH